MTLYINENVTLIASTKTGEKIRADIQRAQEERNLEQELFCAMREAANAGDWDYYSDLHKDVYGVRPACWATWMMQATARDYARREFGEEAY